MMLSLRSTLLAACCIVVHAPVPAAATIAIDGGGPQGRITVTIRDASIGAALRDIGRTYGFAIKGALGSDDEAVSTTISGNLEDVLARLLRNVDHVIVRSPDRLGGIDKVIIIERGSAPQPGTSQAGTDRSPLQEERD